MVQRPLSAWWALILPETPGHWHERRRADKHTVLRLEFKTFLNAFVRLPCQIIRTGHRLINRLLSWNPWQNVFAPPSLCEAWACEPMLMVLRNPVEFPEPIPCSGVLQLWMPSPAVMKEVGRQ
jgi:hypothetical protein